MCWTLSPVVLVRMISLFDNTLIQYVFRGPYNTSSGHFDAPNLIHARPRVFLQGVPKKLPDEGRRNFARQTHLRCHGLESHATYRSAASPLRLLDKRSDSRGADAVRLNALRRASCEGARDAAAAIVRA